MKKIKMQTEKNTIKERQYKMLLKELYNTKIDRMTQENYTRHLFQTFGIEVYEVAENIIFIYNKEVTI